MMATLVFNELINRTIKSNTMKSVVLPKVIYRNEAQNSNIVRYILFQSSYLNQKLKTLF